MRFAKMRQALLIARDERQIAQVLRDGIAAVTAEEMETLPPECRIIMLATGDDRDIHGDAVTLLQADLSQRGDPGVGELLRELGEVYAAASVRLSQLHGRHRS